MLTASEAFEAERPRLTGLAYRITGSHHDAEDIVQEAWLRYEDAAGEVLSPAAWLTTVVTRLAIDRTRRVATERSHYVGPWLPEPTAIEPTPDVVAAQADSLTLAFLVMLDRLSALERAAFVLVDVFGEPYASVAHTLGRSEAACRQLVHRARASLRGADETTQRPLDDELLGRLVGALVEDDQDALLDLLAPDVVLVSDGGTGQHAARRPVVGRDRVGRFLANLSRRDPTASVTVGDVNFASCLFVRTEARTVVLTGAVRDGRVVSLTMMLNPDKVDGVERRRRME